MRRDLWRRFDFWLFGSVVALSIFGVVMIRSAIAGNEELLTTVNRQIVFVLAGIGVILVLTLIDYHSFAPFSRPLHIFTIGLLLFVFFAGILRFGAARWIEAGGIVLQPTEIAKITMILVLADYFASHQNDPHDLRWLGQSLIITGSVVIWILLQPNLSNTIVIMVIWFSLIWLSGLPVRYILTFMLIAIVLFGVAFPFLADYQKERILGFLFTDSTATYGNSYNVDQALVSIGSGGLLGQGYGHSSQVQLRFLKVRHTDFIFSAMAAEFGFIGTVLIMLLLLFVIYRCLRAARLASDAYGAYIAYGFGVLLFFQTAVNIGVNLSLIPVTGLTLPFISSGGSSLVSLAIGIGMVESVVSRGKSLI
jgi:rod shape determining protein RodA